MQLQDYLDNADLVAKLKTYEALLFKWQKSINLVAPSTIKEAWSRHILDSMAFIPYISDEHKHITDIGSGAGFPVLVLALCCPEKAFTVIESDERKVIFMQNVSRETGLDNVTFITGRIEDHIGNIPLMDLLTARALAPLGDLLYFLKCSKAKNGLFTKGAQYKQEIMDAKPMHEFNVRTNNHEFSPETKLLFVTI